MLDYRTFVLVNVNQVEARELVVQAGAYAEHQFSSIAVGGTSLELAASNFMVRLEPGSGARVTASMKRYANQPTLRFPW